MPLTYDLIKRLSEDIPGYNQRPQTFPDFEALCAQNGIVTFEHTMPSRGWYFVMRGYPFIVINKNILPGHKTFVGFHEYFHHRFHPGGHHFYTSLGIDNKVELQASILAAIAVIPTPLLGDDLARGENLAEKYALPGYLVDFRLKTYEDYRELFLASTTDHK